MQNGTKGFTLIEVLVSIGIFTVLLLAIYYLFTSLYRQQGTDMAVLERTRQAGKVVEDMARELREANRGANGNFALALADDNQLAFFSDIDQDGMTERILYFIDGTYLKKTVTEAGGDNSYAGAGSTFIACEGLQNGTTAAFTYYDKNYTGAESALDTPADVLKVRLVGVSLTFNSSKRNSSYPLHIETKIELRNLK